MIEVLQETKPVNLGEVFVRFAKRDACSDFDSDLLKPYGGFSGERSAGSSQLTIVCWCCSTRRTFASGRRRSPFIMRAVACEKRSASDSPFIKMMRTRVNASSSGLLVGACTSSRHVKFCLSRIISP